VEQPGAIGGGEPEELRGASGVKLPNLFGYESDDVAERLQLLCLRRRELSREAMENGVVGVDDRSSVGNGSK